jgi:hypothetical protein
MLLVSSTSLIYNQFQKKLDQRHYIIFLILIPRLFKKNIDVTIVISMYFQNTYNTLRYNFYILIYLPHTLQFLQNPLISF